MSKIRHNSVQVTLKLRYETSGTDGLYMDVSCAKMPGPLKFIAVKKIYKLLFYFAIHFSHRKIIDSLK